MPKSYEKEHIYLEIKNKHFIIVSQIFFLDVLLTCRVQFSSNLPRIQWIIYAIEQLPLAYIK